MASTGLEKLESMLPRFCGLAIHFTWIGTVRTKYEKHVNEGNDVSGPCRILAVKVLGDNGVAEKVEELYQKLLNDPKKPVSYQE